MVEVTKRNITVYTVDGQDFGDHLEALNHASWLDCVKELTNDGYHSLEYMLKENPNSSLRKLQEYIDARQKNYVSAGYPR